MARKSNPTAAQVIQDQMNRTAAPSDQLGGQIGESPVGSEGAQNVTADSLRIADLEAQISAITQLLRNQNADGSPMKKLPKIRQYRAQVAFFEDEFPVVAFGSVKTKKVNGEETMKFVIGILKDGKVVDQEVDYMPFMNETVRYQALIVKQTKEEKEKHQGSQPIRHTTVNPDPLKITDDAKGFAERDIILEHTQQTITCEVKMLEGPMKGETFVLAAEALNR